MHMVKYYIYITESYLSNFTQFSKITGKTTVIILKRRTIVSVGVGGWGWGVVGVSDVANHFYQEGLWRNGWLAAINLVTKTSAYVYRRCTWGINSRTTKPHRLPHHPAFPSFPSGMDLVFKIKWHAYINVVIRSCTLIVLIHDNIWDGKLNYR